MYKEEIWCPITFADGTTETKTLSDWAIEWGLQPSKVMKRYYEGIRDDGLLAPNISDRLTENDVTRLWHGKWTFVGVENVQKKKERKWVYVGTKQ